MPFQDAEAAFGGVSDGFLASRSDRKIADSMNDKINQSNPDDDDGSSGVLARVS
ncbi:hypothetical protein [Nonomuraea sp. NPDC049480]|uniref:hypothetical protein n=1 Tax=Nonomuraea sp. NPDC049480 TaxID=3364353 RepID=UPI00379C6E8C